MQLGEAEYSDICVEGRDSIKPRSVGLDRDGYSHEDRREAARVDAAGKYEPKLTEMVFQMKCWRNCCQAMMSLSFLSQRLRAELATVLQNVLST